MSRRMLLWFTSTISTKKLIEKIPFLMIKIIEQIDFSILQELFMINKIIIFFFIFYKKKSLFFNISLSFICEKKPLESCIILINRYLHVLSKQMYRNSFNGFYVGNFYYLFQILYLLYYIKKFLDSEICFYFKVNRNESYLIVSW